MNNQTKILTNVFLNTSENDVALVNIFFDDKIRKIERISNREYSWSEIDSLEKRNRVLGTIEKITPPSNVKIIDGEFNLVIPGAIDPHVHYNTPGFEFRDTFEHGTNAAAYGGVTSIIDMPCTSLPPVTSLKNFNEKLNVVKDRALVDFAFWGGVCGNNFDNNEDLEKNINELNEAGVASYKAYLISGMDTFKDLSIDHMRIAADLIAKTRKPLGVHAEDKNLIETRREEFKSNNLNTWEYYCSARDDLAEEAAVKDMIQISKKTGAKIHIVHLSSELGLNAIKLAKQKGINISAETCSHYLHFTLEDFNNSEIRNYLKTAPPIKKTNDQKAMWDGIIDGVLSFVTTDHAGCDPTKEKFSDNFWKVYGGIPGVEHRVQHLISEGFKKNKLTLKKTIDLLSTNAAEYFNLANKGKIKEGFDADFALLNLWESEIIDSKNMHSKGKYTPFDGEQFDCKIEKTILRGSIVMDREIDAEEKIGFGKFIEVH